MLLHYHGPPALPQGLLRCPCLSKSFLSSLHFLTAKSHKGVRNNDTKKREKNLSTRNFKLLCSDSKQLPRSEDTHRALTRSWESKMMWYFTIALAVINLTESLSRRWNALRQVWASALPYPKSSSISFTFQAVHSRPAVNRIKAWRQWRSVDAPLNGWKEHA